jgi:glyceraldehyde-3-phosphate dehydrogenase/erythrose-4-phosphate dehydrogenase
LNDHLLKLGIRYDNERWYACRVADLVKYIM